jgi:hypothetical protein
VKTVANELRACLRQAQDLTDVGSLAAVGI